ncbi:MFS transporter [Nocardioides panacis]|uniref:MFS transporter n=1 Tax=Nocardioides panacis TaxID=2849501 RepID=A0A975Y0M1_9ACTN|nr:MFS transporter [Nocardioides panacis]QWZ08602.1 MFS transporter [Nocardioides panacis]
MTDPGTGLPTVAPTDAGGPEALRRLKAVFAASGGGIGTLMPYLALYLAWRGLSPSGVGLVLGLMAAVGVVAVPVWGAWADRRHGAQQALRLSCFAAALASVVLLCAGGWLPAVLVSAALLAAMRAPGEALADALAVGLLGRSARQRYGSIRLWSSAGFAVAVAGWGVLLARTSLALVLLAYPAVLLLEVAAVRGLRAPVRPRAAAPAGWRDVLAARFVLLLAGAWLFGVAMGGSMTVLPLRLTALGGGVSAVAAASVAGALTEIPFMRSVGWWHHLVGPGAMFLGGGAVFALSLACYGVLTDPWLLVAASVLRGAGYALFYVSLVTAVGSLLPAHQQGTGQALLQTTLMGLAPMVGASLGGITYQHSPTAVFLTAAALALVGAAVARRAVDWLAPSEGTA